MTTAPDHLPARLDAGAAQLGLTLTLDQRDRLLALVALLARWNRTYNLTAVRDPLAMVAYHLLDSLALTPYLSGATVLDLGTGAGFPGLPLAILHPERRFTLMDGNGKKVRFVRQAVLELGLTNVEAVQMRIESYKSEVKFATIVARALAPLPQLLDWVAPLLQRPGVLLAPKGRKAPAELDGLDLAPGRGRVALHPLRVPYVDGERALVEIEFI